MLLSIQTSLYLITPKNRGCVRPSVPRIANWVTYTQEYIYCYRSEGGLKIATLDEYERSYFEPDPEHHPITIADFQWIDRGSMFQRYSLLSIGGYTRRLSFAARSGSRGEYQEVPADDLYQLQRAVAGTTKQLRLFQPGNSRVSIPIVEWPMILLKVIVQIGLVICSVKLSKKYENLNIWRSRIDKLRDTGLCIHCTYNCKDLPTPTCPECGQPHTVQN